MLNTNANHEGVVIIDRTYTQYASNPKATKKYNVRFRKYGPAKNMPAIDTGTPVSFHQSFPIIEYATDAATNPYGTQLSACIDI